jgi:hypothetical protein
MEGQDQPTNNADNQAANLQPGATVDPGATAAPTSFSSPREDVSTPSNPAATQNSGNQPNSSQSTNDSRDNSSYPAPIEQSQQSARSPFALPDFLTQFSSLGQNDEPNETSAPAGSPNDNEVIEWTASEYIAHQKTLGWYAVLGLASAALAGIIWLITRDTISAVVVLVAAIILGAYGARQPRQLQYRLDGRGLTIGEKHYSYAQFRSFAFYQEGAFSSISFMPLKRFAPLTTIYYAPEDERRIVEMLIDRLPMEEGRRDLIDQFMSRIRF